MGSKKNMENIFPAKYKCWETWFPGENMKDIYEDSRFINDPYLKWKLESGPFITWPLCLEAIYVEGL